MLLILYSVGLVPIIVIIISFFLVISACKHLPVGTSMLFLLVLCSWNCSSRYDFFGDPFNFLKVGLIILLVIGIIGLKLSTEEAES